MQNKAQVSIFLLIAVIFFIVLILIVYPRLDVGDGGSVVVTQTSELDMKQVEEYIKQTLIVAIEESLQEIEDKGYIYDEVPQYNDLPLAIEFTQLTTPTEYINYPYEQFIFPPTKVQPLGINRLEKLCDSRGENAPNIHAVQTRSCERQLYDVPNTDTDLQTQMRKKIKADVINSITSEKLNKLVQADYKFRENEPQVQVSFTENSITAVLYWNITGTKEETTHTIDEVAATKVTRFPLMYTLMYKAVERERQDIMFDMAADYIELLCPDFSKNNLCSDGVYMSRETVSGQGMYKYMITDESQQDKLEFYVQNRNPAIEDFPLTNEELTDGDTHTIPLNIRDPDDVDVVNIDVTLLPMTTGETICGEVVDGTPYVTTDTHELMLSLKELPNYNENGDSTDENNDGDCTLDPPGTPWGCYDEGLAYGYPTDGETNDLHCQLKVTVEDENGMKDEAVLSYTVVNDEYTGS